SPAVRRPAGEPPGTRAGRRRRLRRPAAVTGMIRAARKNEIESVSSPARHLLAGLALRCGKPLRGPREPARHGRPCRAFMMLASVIFG
ncbi:hypothetical protein, partial [Burkholderia glumae]